MTASEYKKYLADINANYIARLVQTGKRKVEHGMTVGGQDVGLGGKGAQNVRSAAGSLGLSSGMTGYITQDSQGNGLAVGNDILGAISQPVGPAVGMGDLRRFESTQVLPGIGGNTPEYLRRSGARFDTEAAPARRAARFDKEPTPAVHLDAYRRAQMGLPVRGPASRAVSAIGRAVAPIVSSQADKSKPGAIEYAAETAGKLYAINRIQDTAVSEARKIYQEQHPGYGETWFGTPPSAEIKKILADPKNAERIRRAQLPVAREAAASSPVYTMDGRIKGGAAGMEPQTPNYGYEDANGNPLPPTLAEKRYVDEVLLHGRPVSGNQKPAFEGSIPTALASGDRTNMPPLIYGHTAYTLFNSANQAKLAEQYGLEWGSVESMMEGLEYEFDPLIRPLGAWIKRVPAKPAVQYPFQRASYGGYGGRGGGGGSGYNNNEGRLWNWNVRIT